MPTFASKTPAMSNTSTSQTVNEALNAALFQQQRQFSSSLSESSAKEMLENKSVLSRAETPKTVDELKTKLQEQEKKVVDIKSQLEGSESMHPMEKLGLEKELAQAMGASNILIFSFLLYFVIGGSTGVILASNVVDIALHDTYYVVAHFHFVLSLGATLAFLVGVIYSMPFFTTTPGAYVSTNAPQLALFSLSISAALLLVFVPLHFLGFTTLPRRYPDCADSINPWAVMATIGSLMSFYSFFLLRR